MYSFIFILVILSLIGGIRSENVTYTTRYDHVDLDEILTNDRLLSNYVNCLLERGPCTPDGKELKKNLPDAIDNGCERCSEKQRIGSDKVMHYIIDHRPKDWVELEKKYNSDGSYKMKYLKTKESNKNEKKVNDTKNNENTHKNVNEED